MLCLILIVSDFDVERRQSTTWRSGCSSCGCSYPASSPSQGIARPARHQSSAHQVEIGQGEHGKGTHCVLVDAAVAHLGEAPQSLDDEERVLAKGAPARTATVDRLLVGAQL